MIEDVPNPAGLWADRSGDTLCDRGGAARRWPSQTYCTLNHLGLLRNGSDPEWTLRWHICDKLSREDDPLFQVGSRALFKSALEVERSRKPDRHAPLPRPMKSESPGGEPRPWEFLKSKGESSTRLKPRIAPEDLELHPPLHLLHVYFIPYNPNIVDCYIFFFIKIVSPFCLLLLCMCMSISTHMPCV